MVEKLECATPGLILAGGLSRRMGGGDKCLATLQGRPILAHVIGRLQSQVTPIALNANGDPQRFDGFGLAIVADSVPGFVGPLAGILAGLDWATRAAPAATHLLTTPADTPFLPRDLVARLHREIRTDESVVAESGGRRHPVVGLWSLTLREELRRAVRDDGLRKVEDWLARIGARSVAFESGAVDPFFNINTKDDLERAERVNPE